MATLNDPIIAYDWNNARQNLRVPIYGILCDGDALEFFLFNGTTKSFSFKHGLGPNVDSIHPHRFQLPNPADTSTTCPFIDALRPICEIIFDLLLSGYISSLKAYHNHSISNSARNSQLRKEVCGWEEATGAAVRAKRNFRDAEIKCQTQLTDKANSIAEKGIASLKYRYEIPTFSSIVSNYLLFNIV